jgi:type IV pilus modification protein PilV
MLRNHAFSKTPQKGSAGFSLIEVLIALSIFTIGILGVASLVISSINENGLARRVTEATALAEDRLESMLALPYENIDAGQSTEGAYTVSWNVAQDIIVAQTKSITVTVTWQYLGIDRKVTIQHLLAPNV